MFEALLHPVQAIMRAHERRVAVRTYSALSDHLLQDIGIERKFIEDVVALQGRRSLDEERKGRTVFSAKVGTAMQGCG